MNLTQGNKLEQDMYYLRSHIHDMRSPVSTLKMIASYEDSLTEEVKTKILNNANAITQALDITIMVTDKLVNF